jgi:hypothetical protein
VRLTFNPITSLPLPPNKSIKSKQENEQEKGSQGEVFNEVEVEVYVGKMIWEHSLPFKPTPISKNGNMIFQFVKTTD